MKLISRGILRNPPTLSNLTQRSNVGHARGDQFWPPARRFFAQKFRGKYKVMRRVSERNLG